MRGKSLLDRQEAKAYNQYHKRDAPCICTQAAFVPGVRPRKSQKDFTNFIEGFFVLQNLKTACGRTNPRKDFKMQSSRKFFQTPGIWGARCGTGIGGLYA